MTMAYTAAERMRMVRLSRKPRESLTDEERSFVDSYQRPRRLATPRIIDVAPEPPPQLPPPVPAPASSSSSPPPNPPVPESTPAAASSSSEPSAQAPDDASPTSTRDALPPSSRDALPPASATSPPPPPPSAHEIVPLAFEERAARRDGVVSRTIDEGMARLAASGWLWLVSWAVKFSRPDRERVSANKEEIEAFAKAFKEIVEKRFPDLAPLLGDYNDIANGVWTTSAYYGRARFAELEPGRERERAAAPAPPAQLPPPTPPSPIAPAAPEPQPTNGARKRTGDSL